MTDATELTDYCRRIAEQARAASYHMASQSTALKNDWLRQSASALRAHTSDILVANEQDVAGASEYGLTPAQIDRLMLNAERIDSIANSLEEIAALNDPVGETIETTTRPNGLEISRIRVPLGVIFFIYESRPNVTADAAAICVKSGNAVILRGGKESARSSHAIVNLLNDVGRQVGLPTNAVQLVEPLDREAVGHFLGLSQLIDLAIPRGGESLIRRVAAEATMPVLKHFSGNCHVYVDRSADLEMAESVTINAKCQRMGVCNAAESLLIDAPLAEAFLPRIAGQLQSRGIQLLGDARSCQLVAAIQPATEDDFATEFLGPRMSVAIVDGVDAAISHIHRYGSQHTDAIIASNPAAIDAFVQNVDTAAVMVNASTRFHDGGQFGLGAEIGISTGKLHARGPCGLRELTTYKYVVRGKGQIRE